MVLMWVRVLCYNLLNTLFGFSTRGKDKVIFSTNTNYGLMQSTTYTGCGGGLGAGGGAGAARFGAAPATFLS